ncbi:MAG: hypothetical protein PHF53_10370 [Bacteroidales bacterium]|jgi:hypothetical protein|nr:hypothetical protein [Bacteroidales bacterium]
MTKWKYGDSWEKYPIEEGEIWQDPLSLSRIAVADLRNDLPFDIKAEMVYMDSPWNKGNVNSFITKAGMNSYIDSFEGFMDCLFNQIKKISPEVCYLEIGKQHKSDFISRLNVLFPVVQDWQIVYYKKNPCYLLRAGEDITEQYFTGLDDEVTPLKAIQAEKPSSVVDLCTGRGLTLLAAHKFGARFYGTELNKRRLAVAIDRASKAGVFYEKCDIQ